MGHEQPTVLDLFAGCGGLSLGLERAGFIPVGFTEIAEEAAQTYLHNRHVKDLREIYELFKDVSSAIHEHNPQIIEFAHENEKQKYKTSTTWLCAQSIADLDEWNGDSIGEAELKCENQILEKLFPSPLNR